MSRRTIFITTLIVIVFLLFFIMVQQTKSYSKKTLPPSETEKSAVPDLTSLDVQNWHEFASEELPFKVMFPSLPQHAADKQHNTADDSERKYDMYISQKPNGTIFAITVVQFDNKHVKEDSSIATDTLQQLLSAKTDNTLISKKEITWHDVKALDFEIKQNDVIMAGRIFIKANRLYILTVTSEKSLFNEHEIAFFKNSFDLEENGSNNKQ